MDPEEGVRRRNSSSTDEAESRGGPEVSEDHLKDKTQRREHRNITCIE